MDLVTWLRARLDEDELAARAAGRTDDGRGGEWTAAGLRSAYDARVDDHIARHDPARVLAEVEAKRRVVDECDRTLTYEDHGYAISDMVLRLLALPYAGEPGYDEAWRPAGLG